MTRQSATASPQPDPDRPGRSRRRITTRTHPQADSASPLASWHSTAGLDDRPAARPALNRPDLHPLIFQDRAGHSRAKPANVDLTAAHLDPGGASRRTGHLIGVPGAQRQRGGVHAGRDHRRAPPVTTILWICALAATLPRSWQARAGTIPLATTRARRLRRAGLSGARRRAQDCRDFDFLPNGPWLCRLGEVIIGIGG